MSAKPIPPKTTAKLAEAERYLADMERTGEATGEFARLVGNFLTAARSVKDVLINEIAGGNTTIEQFITKKMNADAEMKKLVKARNTTIHEGVLTLKIDWVPDTFPQSRGDKGLTAFFRRHRLRRVGRQPVHRSRMVGMSQATEMIARAFLPDIADRDAYTICVEHLGKIRKAADECVQKYG